MVRGLSQGSWEVIVSSNVEDVFTCNRCGREFRARRQSSIDQEIQLPLDWLRFDVFVGDEKGIAQDGTGDPPYDIELHYCPECKPVVLKLLGPLPTCVVR